MKIKKLPILLVGFTLGLTSCSASQQQAGSSIADAISEPAVVSSEGTTSSTPEEPPSPVVTNVLTDELIAKNVQENKDFDDSKIAYKKTKIAIPSEYELVNEGESVRYVVIEKDGLYGVYNYLAGSVILEPRLEAQPYSFYNDQYFGFHFAYLDTDERNYLADGAGNVLCSFSTHYSSHYNTPSYYLRNDKLYSRVYVYDYDGTKGEAAFDGYKYYVYSDKGVASEVDEIPEQEEEEIEGALQVGDLYVNAQYRYDLSPFGAEKYILRYNNQYYLRNADDSTVGSFSIPNGANAFFVGAKLYYQIVTELPDDATEYDLYEGGDKELLETRVVDLLTLENKEYKTNYRFMWNAPLLDEKEVANYSVVYVTEINANKVYGSSKIMVMDQDGVFHDDLTDNGAAYMAYSKKLSNGNYYCDAAHILVDKDLNLLCQLPDNGNFNYEKELFIGYEEYQGDNRLVVVNNEGKLLVPQYEYHYGNHSFFFNNVMKVYKTSNYYAEPFYFNLETGKEVDIEAKDNEYIEVKENGLIFTTIQVEDEEHNITYTLNARQADSDKNLFSLNNLTNGLLPQGSFTRSFYDGYYYFIQVNYLDKDENPVHDIYRFNYGETFNIKKIAEPEPQA